MQPVPIAVQFKISDLQPATHRLGGNSLDMAQAGSCFTQSADGPAAVRQAVVSGIAARQRDHLMALLWGKKTRACLVAAGS